MTCEQFLPMTDKSRAGFMSQTEIVAGLRHMESCPKCTAVCKAHFEALDERQQSRHVAMGKNLATKVVKSILDDSEL